MGVRTALRALSARLITMWAGEPNLASFLFGVKRSGGCSLPAQHPSSFLGIISRRGDMSCILSYRNDGHSPNGGYCTVFMDPS
ncbi:hypothetical protein H4582DRAFT_1925719 [Lactarius indigo]|nr:hypothetical protein H4582DRAFT_1925719 [Lactarius indigo]